MKILPVKENISLGDRLILKGSDAVHIAGSLRLGSGDKLRLYTASGEIFLGAIEKTSKYEVTIFIESKENFISPPQRKVIIAQGIIKADRFEWVLQKSCELGIFSIIPFTSKRTVSIPYLKKKERWEKIIAEASKQSGNPYPPELDDILTFDKALKKIPDKAVKIIFWEEEGESLKNILASDDGKRDIALIIGSEGGFCRDEIELAKRHDCRVGTLGWRILRCETAAITAVSIVQHFLGEIG